MASDYVRGEMDIDHQKSTFDGFIAVSVWGSLAFAAGMDWLAALIATGIVGGVLGMALGMKTSWYVTLAGLFVFGLACGGLVQLFGMAFGG